MYNRIGVIGVGSIGSYISKYISESEITQELFIIDFDRVELKNIKNSIYKKSHIGKFKVDALAAIIKSSNCNTKIRKSKKIYEEGILKIPKCDLLLDCRDYTYDRGKNIHIRLYITARFLCIDCRTNISYNNKYNGIYNTKLSKTDLKLACISFTQLLEKGMINEIIKKKDVYTINIDTINEDIGQLFNERLNNNDLIIDTNENSDKIINLLPDCNKILKNNKEMNGLLYIGDKNNPILQKEIPKNIFQNENDIIKFLSSINIPSSYNSYYVNINVINNFLFLQLLPETGAA